MRSRRSPFGSPAPRRSASRRASEEPADSPRCAAAQGAVDPVPRLVGCLGHGDGCRDRPAPVGGVVGVGPGQDLVERRRAPADRGHRGARRAGGPARSPPVVPARPGAGPGRSGPTTLRGPRPRGRVPRSAIARGRHGRRRPRPGSGRCAAERTRRTAGTAALGQQAGQRGAPRQPPLALAQCLVDPVPRLSGRLGDRDGCRDRPAPVGGVIGVGPGQDPARPSTADSPRPGRDRTSRIAWPSCLPTVSTRRSASVLCPEHQTHRRLDFRTPFFGHRMPDNEAICLFWLLLVRYAHRGRK